MNKSSLMHKVLPLIYILSKENRICKFCNNLGSSKIEDEIHFS